MITRTLAFAFSLVLAGVPGSAQTAVGRKLPEVQVADKGEMALPYSVQNGKMVMAGKAISYHPWKLSASNGRVRTIYHLAAKMGIDNVNKPFIDAIIAAHLPEFLPDSPYKTITVLNLSEANFVTHGVGVSRLEGSQRDSPHALVVADEKGLARAAWGLQSGQSAVVILDKEGTVLFVKEGKLSDAEISQALAIIKGKL